jgi:hypothetical protein
VGNAGGQAWAGLFRDVDGNGVMEFAAESTPRPGRWTTELNFLGWQPLSGAATTELPKGRVRVSVQWREPHDPAFATSPDDPYRMPLADLQLVVLRQRDPTGAKLPIDDLEAVSRSSGLPLRIASEPGSAVYEQTVEFNVETPGNYALRVEGRVPRSIRPPSFPTLPSLETIWELWPRCFVESLDSQSRNAGRMVFFDYATSMGNLGTPADARANISIGAADRGVGPEPYTSGGPPLEEALLIKPDALVADGIVTGLPGPKTLAGSEVSTAFAAGVGACALSARVPADELVRSIRAKPGKLLRLP